MLRDKPFKFRHDMEAEHAKEFDSYLDDARSEINNRVDSRQKFDTTTPAVADSEFRIVHKLGFIPTGFALGSINKAGQLYRGVTAWTNQVAYFKCSAASAEVSILIW